MLRCASVSCPCVFRGFDPCLGCKPLEGVVLHSLCIMLFSATKVFSTARPHISPHQLHSAFVFHCSLRLFSDRFLGRMFMCCVTSARRVYEVSRACVCVCVYSVCSFQGLEPRQSAPGLRPAFPGSTQPRAQSTASVHFQASLRFSFIPTIPPFILQGNRSNCGSPHLNAPYVALVL